MSIADPFSQEEQAQATFENAADARRVCLTDSAGSKISGSNPLPVTTSAGTPTTTAIEFQKTASVAASTLTTVLSFTPSVTVRVDAVGGTGEADGEWSIFINTVEVLRRRGTGSDLNFDVEMFSFKLLSTDTIDIKIQHFRTGKTPDFQAEVRYHND